MRHFAYLSSAEAEAVFAHVPGTFDRDTDRSTLGVALGATLYTPGTSARYVDQVRREVAGGIASSVLCLEDAIADTEVPEAERNVVAQLVRLHRSGDALPLLFVRVRHPEQVRTLVRALGPAVDVLAGFVFPKFTSTNGRAYFQALTEAREATGLPLYGMPVLETGEVLYSETRLPELLALRALLAGVEEMTLAVRIGATDLCGLFGLRRSRDLTIYDLALIREAIADIVNVFARDDAFTVSGPVWEYFTSGERMFKPQLRHTPFDPDALDLRSELVMRDLDGLLREVVLDRATGITGKTVIHPTHVRPVHAMYVVTAEEYSDACQALDLPDGGVVASAFGDKMIESRPHARWARRILQRASVFGVLREDRSFVDLLGVGA